MIKHMRHESIVTPEKKEQEPMIRYKIIRHAERTVTGQLTPDGIEHAKRQGEALRISAEAVKGYSSREKSDRAYQTVDTVSEASGAKSPLTGSAYETRRRPGLFYDLSGPLMPRIEQYTKMINEAVKKDYPDFDANSDDPKWGKIRKEYQPVAIKGIIANDPELTHIFSMGAAHQLQEMMDISSRYTGYREKKAKESGVPGLQRDLVMLEGTHGGFLESLLKKALVRVSGQGQEKVGFDAYTDGKGNPEFEPTVGGIFKPGESFEIIDKAGQIQENRLPIEFEGASRFPGEKCFLDREKIGFLANQFAVYADQLEGWKANKKDADALAGALGDLMNDFERKYGISR